MELYKIFIYSILTVNSFIILDSFLLPPVERNEIYYMRSDVVSPGTYGAHYTTTTEYLVTTNGHRYELPDHIYMRRTEGDSVTVGISRLFRRPFRVSWNDGEGQHRVDIRAYTHGLFYPFIFWFSTLLCLLLLIFPAALRPDNRLTLLVGCAFFTAMLFAFTFW